MLTLSWPVALASLSAPALQLVELAIVGHLLGVTSLASCTISLVVANVVLEPSAFVLTNAVTTLCAGLSQSRDAMHITAYLRGAFTLSVLLSVPIVVLLLMTPRLLRLCAPLPANAADAAGSYAAWYGLSVLPSLLLASLVGLLRAQGRLRSTALLGIALVPLDCALAFMLVPPLGVVGSALGTAATRALAALGIAVYHRDVFAPCLCSAPSPPYLGSSDSASFGRAAEHASAVPRPPPPTTRRALQLLARHYRHSLLPATLHTGIHHLLTLVRSSRDRRPILTFTLPYCHPPSPHSRTLVNAPNPALPPSTLLKRPYARRSWE